jgi:hypothetical protein
MLEGIVSFVRGLKFSARVFEAKLEIFLTSLPRRVVMTKLY